MISLLAAVELVLTPKRSTMFSEVLDAKRKGKTYSIVFVGIRRGQVDLALKSSLLPQGT